MKKVIAAAAGLMLVGAMASAAVAEVTMSGDARVRYIYKNSYDFGANAAKDGWDYFDSRIRVKVDATAKGGAFMKARMRFDDYKWDGQGWGAASEDKNIWVDYGYIGIPMGNVTLMGGRMVGNFSEFFSYDTRPSRVMLQYKSGGLTVKALVDTKDDANVGDNGPTDVNDDNDFRAYGLVVSSKINDAWSVKAYARYQDDERMEDISTTTIIDDLDNSFAVQDGDAIELNTVTNTTPHTDASGFLGSIHVDGKVDALSIAAELAYKESDVQGTVDNGIGIYANLAYAMGAMTPSVNIGITRNGYTADGDFGWIMIGDIEPLSVVSNVGSSDTEWWWIAPSINYAISDNMSLTGNLVYVDFSDDDNNPATNLDGSAFELSAMLKYTVSEGADLYFGAGMLSPDFDDPTAADDTAYGAMAKMQIKF
ncbi:porin [Desulfolithobacter sp.]